jgi:CO/xanthine dehydrogenase Mo-binding subunit
MIVGKLVESAATALRETLIQSKLLAEPYQVADWRRACAEYVARFGALRARSQHQHSPDIHWDDQSYRGDAYGAYAWAVYVAEVSVDTLSFEVRVQDFVAVQEVGKVIHPVLAAGQIEGGVAQAIGYALYEKVAWQGGRMANAQMTNYIIPTSADVPRIRVYFEEVPHRLGPYGAKGLGELPMDGPAPAILSAVENAVGVAVHKLPLLPEDVMEAVESAHAQG